MAPDFETAQQMVNACKIEGSKLYIHENYRWQAPVRRFKQIVDSGVTGKPFKARVTFLSGFPYLTISHSPGARSFYSYRYGLTHS